MLKDRSVYLKDLLNIYRIITQIYEEDPTIPLLKLIEDKKIYPNDLKDSPLKELKALFFSEKSIEVRSSKKNVHSFCYFKKIKR